MVLSNTIRNKILKIKLIVSDVDGVLTDGKIYLDHKGDEIKVFYTRDALRIEIALRSGISMVWLTGRRSAATLKRGNELGVKVFYKEDLAKGNISFLNLITKKYHVTNEEIAYIGDDWNDLFFMNQVGLAVTPSNGSSENKRIAQIITQAGAGQGVLAEIIEIIMKIQGTWDRFSGEYKNKFIH